MFNEFSFYLAHYNSFQLTLVLSGGVGSYPDWYDDAVTLRLHSEKLDRGRVSGLVTVYKNIHDFISEEFVKITK